MGRRAGARGIRLHLRDCDGTVRLVLEFSANERSFGPFHACRPNGNAGVSAFNARGESAIAWAR